jgi:hypothetical protein
MTSRCDLGIVVQYIERCRIEFYMSPTLEGAMSDASGPALRHRTLKGARLVFNHGHSTMDCVVRDLSETGAKVMVVSSLGLPDRLTLVFDDGKSRDCSVARRQLSELGLHFL